MTKHELELDTQPDDYRPDTKTNEDEEALWNQA